MPRPWFELSATSLHILDTQLNQHDREEMQEARVVLAVRNGMELHTVSNCGW